MELLNNVKECRKARGLTQQQLSELSGVPQATISQIEDGKQEPRVYTAILLARALDTTVETLFAV